MDGTVTVAFRTTPLCRDVLVMHGEAGSVVVAGREREPLPMGLAPPTWAAHLTPSAAWRGPTGEVAAEMLRKG